MPKKNSLNDLIYDLRRIEEHREVLTEKKIKAMYRSLSEDLDKFIADSYKKYADEDGRFYLSYLDAKNQRARFLEEVVENVDGLTPQLQKELSKLIDATYAETYKGFVEATKKAEEAGKFAEVVKDISVQPDVLKQAVNNNISKLTLEPVLQKHRGEIIYQIQQELNIGLMNGDRYEKMAKRISERIGVSYSKAMNITRTETHRNIENGLMDGAKKVSEDFGDYGLIYAVTWRTRKDQRVRPQVRRYNKKGKWKTSINPNGANHMELEGQTVKVGEKFDLGNYNGRKVEAENPGNSRVAAHDCNCRCFLEYNIMTVEEFAKATGQSVKKVVKDSNDVSKPQNVTTEYVEGKNKIGDIDYSSSKFDYDIEIAMHEQGFDGLPKVVNKQDFDLAVKQSGMIAQRTYTAPSQEILDAYRDELYNGKWYVDCGKGGAQYGRGMYCVADYKGELSQGIKNEMAHYQSLGKQRTVHDAFINRLESVKVTDFDWKYKITDNQFEAYKKYLATSDVMPSVYKLSKEDREIFNTIGQKAKQEAHGKLSKINAEVMRDTRSYAFTETLTLQPDAKIFTIYEDVTDITNRYSREYALKHVVSDEAKETIQELIELQETIGKATNSYVSGKVDLKSVDALYDKRDKLCNSKVFKEEVSPLLNEGYNHARGKNEGALAVEMGYDAINAIGHGESGSYTVILNRTKVIFCEE